MYNQLFTKILDSSVWLESTPTRIVWITMLAAMDETGFVQLSSVQNVAYRARVELSEAEEAIKTLEGPDRINPDQDHEGRRIERVPYGWMVINAEKYKGLVTRAIALEQNRLRVARFRAKKSGNAHVMPANENVIQSVSFSGSVSNQNPLSSESEDSDPSKGCSKPIFEYYLQKIGRDPVRTKFTPKRQAMLRSRLKEQWPDFAEPKIESAIAFGKDVIDRLAASEWHHGKNPEGKQYLDFEIMFRSREQLEKWLNR